MALRIVAGGALAMALAMLACSAPGSPSGAAATDDAGTGADAVSPTGSSGGSSSDDGGTAGRTAPESGSDAGGSAGDAGGSAGDAGGPAGRVDASGGVDAAAPDRGSDSCHHVAVTFGSQTYPTTVCRVAADGTLACALIPVDPSGGNSSALLPSAPLSDVRCISGGEDFFCALTNSGSVTCWGDRSSFDPAHISQTPGDNETLAIPGLPSDVVDVAAGETHVCVLTSDATVMCWGYALGEDNNGQYLPGTWPLSASPTTVAGIDLPVLKITSGDGFSCALLSDGAVLCWGYDGGGELGDGMSSNSATPVEVAGLPSPAVGVWADQSTYPCALLTDGSVWCWNLVTGGHAAKVEGFSASVTALTVGGEYGVLCALLSTGGVQCWNADALSAPTSVLPAGSGVLELTSGDSDYCALLSSGGVTCLYDDDTSGVPQPLSFSAPAAIAGL